MNNNESFTLVLVCDFKSVQHAINKNLTRNNGKVYTYVYIC